MKANKVTPLLVAVAALGILCASLSMAQGPAGQGPGSQGQWSQGSAGAGSSGGQGGGMAQSAPLDPSIKRTYVPLGSIYGLLYEPVTPGERAHIAVFVMHAGVDYTSFSACTELSKRGYRVLCTNNTSGILDRNLLDVKRAVTWLRAYPGIQKIILWGHSGGATLLSAYQLIAENGVKACQGPEKIYKCPNNLAGMPAADGVILADSNWGNAEMSLFSIDPAVIEDDNGMKVDPALNLWNPQNGFNPNGNSDYSLEFIRKWQAALAKKETELTRKALDGVTAIEAGKGRFSDDEPFVVAGPGIGLGSNKLFAQDVMLLSHTVKAWPLLHADGTVTNEIIHTVRLPENQHSSTSSLNMGALNTTVRNFLMSSAIRVTDGFGYDEDSVHGVDWTSTYSSTPGNVEGISVPLLVMGMTGHWEFLAAETIYENATSSDKSLAFVEGASHGYTTCKQCEKTPGQFGDTVNTLYNFADKWLSEKGRFLDARGQ